ncbi:molybdate ABC transporter substrate-binding protein [Halobacillus litoralis]|uniref:molybdate ABC transporter substrate-binding protein n=1 Tax=Halobacillus litoralis TaxID=45668 RepID=UPI001CD5DD64|nr:molybdate ABC transporter substrate-binding protein [Halobacillus litoralis]MCA0972372.1 molybdate ABC transporter substrate-binding protein [Halobacillus litoralis]
MWKQATILFILVLALTGCTSNAEEGRTLTISAAASLTDAIEEITANYEKMTDTTITLNVAGSGRLAQQIEQGAPADVFLSANQKWMDQLEESQSIDPSTRVDFVRNRLVVIAENGTKPLSSLQSMTNLGTNEQIALGQPDSVPAGTYTKQALETIQLWDDLEEKMVFGSDVRQVLAYVESGNVTYGIVYGSDAASSGQVAVVSEFESDAHDPIVYPAAVVQTSQQEDSARDFVSYLMSDEAQQILADRGFTPMAESDG